MAYVTAEARQDLLDTIAEAIDAIGVALAALGDAYEQLDEQSAERLEDELFRPLQAAYGRAKQTHAAFADRSGLPAGRFASAAPGRASRGVKDFIASATEAVGAADATLAELQDSMRPVDVGDAELRAGLADVRRLLADTSRRAREFVRRLGR